MRNARHTQDTQKPLKTINIPEETEGTLLRFIQMKKKKANCWYFGGKQVNTELSE